MKVIPITLAAITVFGTAPLLSAQNQENADTQEVFAAILDFEYGDRRFPEMGGEFSDLLNVEMSLSPDIFLIERAELDNVLSEQELGASGLINSATAAKFGNLLGADVLVSGRIIDSAGERIAIARITSADTGRVFAEKVTYKAKESLTTPTAELAEKLTGLIQKHRADLVVPAQGKENVIEQLKPLVKGKDLPTVSVKIPEVHIGGPTPDPAVETEIAFILQKLGFPVVEPGNGEDIQITGEAFSELGLRRGNLVSCRARSEVKAVNRAGDVVFVDRETTMAVGLAERVAGKDALEKAGVELARRLVPVLVQ